MSIATGAMNTLLPKLWELLYGEYKLQKGVKKEIKDLMKELEAINVALRKVSTVPADQLDEQAKLWARDAKELSYDIEDAVDIFVVKKKGHEPAKPFSFKGFIDRTSNLFKKAKTNHQMHNVIKDIMDEVKKVSERRDRYKVDDLAARTSAVTIDPRLEAVLRKATDLVGIEGPKNDLVKRLQDERSPPLQQQNIISIVGFGGLGKTTLANAVLHDLKAKFDSHFFVSVSLNPDINRIFKNILSQLDEKKYAKINEAWDERQLISEIRAFLENKRFLCVIDDVWNETAWDAIKLALQDGSHESKIIITTRNKAVAEFAGGGFYDLKPLSDEDSKNLFYKRIFDSQDGCPPDLCKVTEKILKKCGGVPLAVVTIASLLARKPRQLQVWEKVNESIGSGPRDSSPDVDNIRNILSLSYNDLPPHLKTCLLSLGKYPEDKKIRMDVLVWSWIAEGFITEKTQPAGTSLQEIGEGYFTELINRCLIQPVDIVSIMLKQDDQVHACQMHDMVLELINKLSAEEGFLTTSLSAGQRASVSLVHKMKIRRLALNNDMSTTYASSEASEQLSQVRSLMIFGHVNSMPPLSTFRVLRALQLEDCSHLKDHHLKDLSRLHLLTFLRLRRLNIRQLPESIGKLELLETLDIRGAKSTVFLPMSFGNLGNLVRLLAEKVKLPHGVSLGKMKSLQELVGICVDPGAIREFDNLPELRAVEIFLETMGVGNAKELILQYLQRSTKLEELSIRTYGDNNIDFVQQVPIGLKKFKGSGLFNTAFPGWINSSLSCLTTLSIYLNEGLRISSQHLEKLAELPSLHFLRITIFGSGGLQQKLSIPSDVCAFRCLRELHFYSSFMFIKFLPGTMPALQRLYLEFLAGETDKFDFGLENLPLLRHVFVDFGHGQLAQEAEATIREALKNNPNRPSLDIVRVTEYAAED